MKKLFLMVFLCTIFVTNISEAKIFNATEFYLKNGLQVVIIPNHKAPIATSMLCYKVGAIDEESGKYGLAHLLEHLMFKGTNKIKDAEFSKIIAKFGGVDNAMTSYDYTCYHQSMSRENLELALYMEADRMDNLNIPDDAFEKEKLVVIEERFSRIKNNPQAILEEKKQSLLWGNSPYAHPISGRIEDIKNITKKDIMDFYNRHYRINNSVLVIAGDLEVEEGKKIANKYFGFKENNKVEKRRFEKSEKGNKVRAKIEMEHKLIQKNSWRRTYIAEKNSYALDIFSNLLAGSSTSKLYKKLVKQDKLASEVYSYYNGVSLDGARFVIGFTPNNDEDTEAIINIIDEEITNITNNLTRKEIEQEKEKMISGLVFLRDNPESEAQNVARLIVSGMSLEQIESWEEDIKKVNMGDVKKVANELINNASFVSGLLMPEKGKDK